MSESVLQCIATSIFSVMCALATCKGQGFVLGREPCGPFSAGHVLGWRKNIQMHPRIWLSG